MPLDTKVEGDPESLTALSQWLQQQAERSGETGSEVYAVRGDSEGGWGEAAGEAFRRMATVAGEVIDGGVRSLADTARALETHAGDLRAVHEMMAHAREVAHGGGLAVHGTIIEEPGRAPANPTPLPQDRPASPQEQHDHASAAAAFDAFEKKAIAYAKVSQIVKDAKKKETRSQHILIRFLNDVSDVVKLALTLTDMSTGAAAAIAMRTSAAKSLADAAMTKAARAANLQHSPNLSLTNQTKAAMLRISNELDAKAEMDKAMSSRAARVIERFPPRTQGVIRFFDTKLAPKVSAGNPIIKFGSKVGSKIPVAGVVFTAIGVGYDISQGKDPTQAVASGAGSLATGVIVGTCIGGPVGAVVGGLLGVGVGFAIDQLWPS